MTGIRGNLPIRVHPFGSNPGHASTGSRGYFANRGSRSDSWQSRNTEPRADRISFP